MKLTNRSIVTLAAIAAFAGSAAAQVDGTGTAGRLAKFMDANTIEDSAIRESNGNVAIGVNPLNALRFLVNGGIGTTRSHATLAAFIANQSGAAAISEFQSGHTTVLTIDNDGDLLFSLAKSSATIGFPVVNANGRDLTIQAGGNLSSHGDAASGGDLILRAGNANISDADGNCPTPGPYGNSVKIYAGDNVFDFVCGNVRNGDVEFYAGDGQPERMRLVGNTGNFGIGTSSPSQRLTVVGNICATGSIGSCSDARFKTNVTALAGALDTVGRMRPVNYEWKRAEFPTREFADGRQVGFIAQDVLDVLPEVVTQGSDGYYSVDYGHLTPVLVAAIQEQQALISAQRLALDAQADRIDALARQVAEIRVREMVSDTISAGTVSR